MKFGLGITKFLIPMFRVEIVLRKNTQLADVTPRTAKKYLDEMLEKYRPGTPIKSGGELRGEMYLEVPVQKGPIPREIIEYAKSLNPPVAIRDIKGNIYG